MGRSPAIIIKSVLSECINQTKNKTYKTSLDLFTEIANLYREKTNKGYSPSTFRSKAIEYGYLTDVKKHRKTAVKIKRQLNEEEIYLIEIIRKSLPQKYKHLCDYIIQNGKKAIGTRIKINCLKCANYNIAEIKNCEMVDCSFYQIRPYKNNVEN